ncbi:MAG: GtrA family protein, partial [Candidatus Lokiarchaeota archaeon]|nr:GtrA family protein [Candidatus Lokiarchaeota archaeon]
DFSIFNLLLFLGLNTLFSSSISFVVAVFNNFFWNRNWTYPESKNNNIGSQIIKFGIVSTIGLVIRTILLGNIEKPIVAFTNRAISANFFVSNEIIGKNISLFIVIIIVLFWNYIANRLWTYKGI